MTHPRSVVPGTASFVGYIAALAMVAASALLGLAVEPGHGTSSIDLLFLPAVLGAAVLGGRGPALVAAASSALAYNFFFTAPRMTFHVDDPNDLVTILILFAVALVVSQLAASVRRQARIAEAHAQRNATIAGFARQLLSCTGEHEIVGVAESELGTIFDCNAVLIGGTPEAQSAAEASPLLTPSDRAVAALVLSSGERAGRGVDRAIPTEWQFHPVCSNNTVLAAMGLARDDGVPALRTDQLPLLDNLLDQLALALERNRIEGEAQALAKAHERDQARETLLVSIGDDIAPPLRVIAAATDKLRREGMGDRETLSQIGGEVARLDRYLANLQEVAPETDRKPVRTGAITIDLFHRAVVRDGLPVHLSPKEYGVLAELARHPGRVLSHGHLLRTVWGPAQESQIDYLRVAVRGLRQKLEDDPAHPGLIVNEPAVGYRLVTGV